MTRRTLVPILASALTSGALSPPPALAGEGDPARADALFNEAVALANASKYSEACPKFAESHKLDPAYGAVLFLGKCYAKLGRAASAVAAFGEALEMARRSRNAQRVTEATKQIEEVSPKLTRIAVHLLGGQASSRVTVTRDGVEIPATDWSTATPIDPGTHVVLVTSPGKIAWSTTLLDGGPGQTVTVEVPPLEDEPPPVAPHAPTPTLTEPRPWTLDLPISPAPPRSRPGDTTSGGTQRTLGWIGVGLGAAGLSLGAGLGLAASALWSETEPYCNARGQCDAMHLGDAREARGLAQASTAAFIAGGALVAAGLVIRLTAPSAPRDMRSRAAPTLSTIGPWTTGEAAGLTLQGRLW